MGHTHTALRTGTSETYKVLTTDVGGEDSHTDYIPGFTLTEEVSRGIFTLLCLLVLHNGSPNCPYNAKDTNGEYQPVKPDKFC